MLWILVPALHLPGGAIDLLEELAAFIAARRVKLALKAVSQKGETESQCLAQAAALSLGP